MSLRLLAPLAGAILALPAAAARADAPIAPAPGAVNLSAAGGYAVWAEPGEDTGWHLVVRAPDGTVSRPALADFPAPPDPSVGTGGGGPSRTLLAVYARRRGGSDDVYALDLRTSKEHLVSAISTAGADERSPSVEDGRLAFVRSGGAHPGVYDWNGRGAARRISTIVATQTAISGSRVAYSTARTVVARPISGRGGALAFRAASRPRSIMLDRYHVGWLETGGRVLRSGRLGGSGDVDPNPVLAASRALAPSTQSLALRFERVALALDGEHLVRIDPLLEFRADPPTTRGA